VSPTGKEKTGYPTQKPLGIIERLVRLHSHPGDTVLDFFAGSGTIGEACGKLGRDFILVDNNPEAIDVMKKRLDRFHPEIRNLPSTPKKPPTVATHGNVHVIAAGVWTYDDHSLTKLQGPAKDLEMVRELFLDSSPIGLYPAKQIQTFANPTVEELRSAIVKYAMDRSAKGDILVFIFQATGPCSQTTSLDFACAIRRFGRTAGVAFHSAFSASTTSSERSLRLMYIRSSSSTPASVAKRERTNRTASSRRCTTMFTAWPQAHTGSSALATARRSRTTQETAARSRERSTRSQKRACMTMRIDRVAFCASMISPNQFSRS
jgi:hypothetical protein